MKDGHRWLRNRDEGRNVKKKGSVEAGRHDVLCFFWSQLGIRTISVTANQFCIAIMSIHVVIPYRLEFLKLL